MFVIGAAMFKTGLAEAIGVTVVKKAGTNEIPLMAAIMVVTIILSAVSSNTGTVACLMRIYGIKIKWIFTEKIKQDKIFGEFSHFKANNKDCFEIYAMPENTDDFDDIERLQTQFPGVLGDGTINLFISKITARDLMQKSSNTQNQIDITAMDSMIQRLHGSLIVLPAGKVMEVTKVDLDAIGMNNAYLHSIDKNAYCVHCKTYIHKTANEISVDSGIKDSESLDEGLKVPNMFDTLDKYFDEMTKRNDQQKEEASERFEKVDPVFGRF